ncbi:MULTISPECIES: hypothetical protein [Planktothricoides]|uniref:Uncharacterized protein n=1 Tax=Planktothricoides raciborskii FACHB-1370 TaxID=2949576 RepID=A0ABR8ECT2_9CYAN|nr:MULTISPECIES: hypothetical protein [Planktothricoides]MBD2543406.1 hypothetical protein [Planktothricoides raciborskii FACHB-1370]MBD2581705.1 hypothetical protein [Planktothricoides raciborskii FACHB-1261]
MGIASGIWGDLARSRAIAGRSGGILGRYWDDIGTILGRDRRNEREKLLSYRIKP